MRRADGLAFCDRMIISLTNVNEILPCHQISPQVADRHLFVRLTYTMVFKS
jgi:hypothetical protein